MDSPPITKKSAQNYWTLKIKKHQLQDRRKATKVWKQGLNVEELKRQITSFSSKLIIGVKWTSITLGP